ncbi:RDD family protein [Quadrisphaera sp. GCM10027208]|uniref:RDD family protein n=1 Tax=Quadrisphaera sp. GCM10027208 TaxID=3273423 RepID=UPI003622D607
MAIPSTELVTGEAVLLDLRPASFATRGLAWLIDAVVQLVVAVALFWLVGLALSGADPAADTAAGIAVLVTVLVGLPLTWETLSRGRSLGKLAMGLRVVRDDGGPVRVRHALIRALVGVGELWLTLGSPAVISSLVHPRGKRIGDLVAGTYVVRERTASDAARPVHMPPELAAWAQGADIARLPGHLALSARQLLARTDRLHPASRQRLGESLAAEFARHVSPPPPAGTHPERFIAAVLAERRERELRRMQADRRRRDERAVRLHRLPFGLDDPTPHEAAPPPRRMLGWRRNTPRDL